MPNSTGVATLGYSRRGNSLSLDPKWCLLRKTNAICLLRPPHVFWSHISWYTSRNRQFFSLVDRKGKVKTKKGKNQSGHQIIEKKLETPSNYLRPLWGSRAIPSRLGFKEPSCQIQTWFAPSQDSTSELVPFTILYRYPIECIRTFYFIIVIIHNQFIQSVTVNAFVHSTSFCLNSWTEFIHDCM